ncbi:MAG: AEC family transporter [Bacillota bacterium]|nr:AEC family transporter [Bacillota bacterium]
MYGRYFVLFAILFTGWLLRKINFIDDKMNHSMNKLIVYFAYPCLIVHNIGSLEMSGRVITDFLITFAMSLALFYLYALFCYYYAKLRKFPAESSNTVEFAMATPNNGFMGFPVALIFFGETGLLLMLAHNAAMNFFIFTYGTKSLRRNYDKVRKATPRSVLRAAIRLLLNPNILALAAGFAISFCGGMIPEAVDEYLLYIGNISTPMAMIFIGSTLAGYKFLSILKSRMIIEAGLVKLLWLPLLTGLLVYFVPVSAVMKCIIVLGASFPSAATVSMLAEQEGQDAGAASQVLFFSTVLSIGTVPLIINILEMLFL